MDISREPCDLWLGTLREIPEKLKRRGEGGREGEGEREGGGEKDDRNNNTVYKWFNLSHLPHTDHANAAPISASLTINITALSAWKERSTLKTSRTRARGKRQ